GFALLDAVALGNRLSGNRVAFGDLPLEVLHARREIACASRELELALVQLSGSSAQTFVTAAGGGHIRLALVHLLLPRLELRTCLSELTSLCRMRLLGHSQLLFPGLRLLGRCSPIRRLTFQLCDTGLELT